MRNSNRRGMLLLVVLALLAMFAMVTVAFVVLTGSEKVSAIRVQQVDFSRDDPKKTLEQGIKVVVNGVPIDPAEQAQPSSAITWQSLLEKIYGFETIGTLNAPCTLSTITSVCNGQLLEFTLPTSNPDANIFNHAPVDAFHCVGCVVTMLDGPAAGLSSRIVGLNTSTPVPNVQMLAFEGGAQPANGNHYIVNGFPYSGMGFGFNNGALTATALTPNAPPSVWKSALSASGGIIPGGVNSDYTAPDYQDPLIAMAVVSPSGGVLVPIPSLHRSDLIAYAKGATPQNMFRPIGQGSSSSPNPNFTGSNPTVSSAKPFNATWDGITPGQGQWDVDNMGTGTPDSVWVDLGQAVRYTTDGRAYKPLFAVLCLDLDGRLNINAHGSFAQTNSNFALASQQNLTNYQTLSKLDVGLYGASNGQSYYAGPVGSQVSTPPVALMRGQGTGPAEVNLLPLFRDPSNAGSFLFPMYQALLLGNSAASNPLVGRYGGGNGMPGLDNQGSALTINNAFPYSGTTGGYWVNYGTTPDAYGSPPDPQCMGAVAIDTAGHRIDISTGGQVVNGPYDIDLTRNAPHAVDLAPADSPFGAAEMERILRFGDRDAATLPQRLFNLTSTGTGSILIGRRTEFTVESNMVPVSAAVLPPGLRANLPNKRSTHPIDILYGHGANMQSVAAQLLPWEVLEGLKMDINRPFGAGAFSTNSNGSISNVYGGGTNKIEPDQPGTSGETVPQYIAAGAGQSSAQFNYSADGSVTDSMAARQLYARHLYVLMLLLADNGAVSNWFPGDPNPDESMKRMFAQWAINVVAYRDHNGIMIPFQYDTFGGPGCPSMSSGWKPTNDVAHTVWGCKRPELLITETLAFHDRRTQDLPDEKVDSEKPGLKGAPPDPNRTDGGLTTSTDPKSKDPSFNSAYRPQGSLFVELYNPWPLMEARTPDLGSPNTPGVELTKVTPPGNAKQPSPVWRMIIIDPSRNTPRPGVELPDPDDPIIGNRPTFERIVYFVPSAMASNAPNDGQVSYHPSAVTQWPNIKGLFVTPGGYAVVGSGDPGQQNHTFIGFENGKTSGSQGSTRMVTMSQGDLVGDPRVVKNTQDPLVMAPPPQVMGIDAPQRLSISEPALGYAGRYERDGTKAQQTPGADGKYPVTLDIPVDEQRFQFGSDSDKTFGPIPLWSTDPAAASILNNDNTTPSYRIIYLQRLADPTRPFTSDTDTTADPRTWNPYRTIDAMTVDLTAFNGMTASKDPTTHTGTFYFESRQRGEKNFLPASPPALPGAVGEANIWKQEPALKGLPLPAPGWSWAASGWTGGGAQPSSPTMNFGAALNQSLGYLNKQFYGQVSTNPATPGDTQYPFPWLNWSYRPFNNVYELLLVPTVSSSRLLARAATSTGNPQGRQFYGYVDGSVRALTDAGGNYTPLPMYDYTVPAAGAPVPVPYPHLLNFFESKQSSAAPGTSAQLSRLFAYLGVPSRFANTQLQVQAVSASSGGAHYFHTPFNRISRYREPGNINMNTISSPDVFFGMLNAYCTPLQQNGQVNPAFWDKFVRSRRGPESGISPATTTAATFNSMFQITGAGPSRFMRPFRTPGGASLVPPNSSGSSNEPARETDVGLLRGDPDGNNRPLFEVDDYMMNSPSSTPPVQTLTVTPGASPDQFPLACMDFNRSPYFRYQLMQKVGSVASTHSNVFAIWLTVGYFEVTPVTAGPGNPDGWQLGQELGADTGDVNRHRAFYIFDRSIPVGFIRGQDINSDKAFLLKRYIE